GRLSPERRGLLVKLAAGWGSKRFEKYTAEVVGTLLARAKDETLGADERITAARELVGHRSFDRDVVTALLDAVTPRTPPDVAAGLLRALQASESPGAGSLILERLPGLTPAARAAGLGVVLTRPEWTGALLGQVERGAVSLADLSLDQRQALADHPDAAIRRRALALLRRGGALPNADRQAVIDELVSVTKVAGDAAAGKAVFKAQCAKCHVHGGEGE